MSATTVRVPVLVGHAEAVWIELERPLSADEATAILHDAPSVTVVDVPTPKDAARPDQVLVGRIRPDRASEHGLALFLACDNLNKGAALNAIQIAELILDRARRGVARSPAGRDGLYVDKRCRSAQGRPPSRPGKLAKHAATLRRRSALPGGAPSLFARDVAAQAPE